MNSVYLRSTRRCGIWNEGYLSMTNLSMHYDFKTDNPNHLNCYYFLYQYGSTAHLYITDSYFKGCNRIITSYLESVQIISSVFEHSFKAFKSTYASIIRLSTQLHLTTCWPI